MATTNVTLTTDWTLLASGPIITTGTVAAITNIAEFAINGSTPSASTHGFKSYQSGPFAFDLDLGENLYGRAMSQPGETSVVLNVTEKIILFSDQVSALNTTTITLTVPAGNTLSILWGDGQFDSVICDGASHAYSHDYLVNGYYGIALVGDYVQITNFEAKNQSWIDGDLALFRDMIALLYLRLYGTSIIGSIAALLGMTLLEQLHLAGLSVTGDILYLSGKPLTYLNIGGTSLTGNLSSIADLINLTFFYFHTTAITGDIFYLADMVNMNYIHGGGAPIYGDILYLAGMTSIIYINLHTTSISGCLSVLNNMPSATGGIRLYNNSLTYTSGALPAWTNISVHIYSTGLDETEVDNFLIDLASGAGTNGDLEINGTNAARTSDSDAAYTYLTVTQGWAVAVN